MQRSCSCSDLPDDVFRSKSNADAGPGDPGETQTQSEQEQEEPEQGQGQEGLGGLFLGGAKASKGYRLVVKNTFVEVQAVQEDDTPTQLRRSLSDGDMQAPCDDTEGEAQREAQHEQCSPEPDQVLCLEAAVRSCERNAASHQPLQQPTQMVAGSMAAPMLSHAAYSGVPDQGFAGIASFAAALGASIALGVPFSPQLWAMQNMAAAQSVAVQAGSRMATGHEANAAEQVTPAPRAWRWPSIPKGSGLCQLQLHHTREVGKAIWQEDDAQQDNIEGDAKHCYRCSYCIYSKCAATCWLGPGIPKRIRIGAFIEPAFGGVPCAANKARGGGGCVGKLR